MIVLRRTVVDIVVLRRTTVLLRTPITQMIFFNQGMLLLGSNHFLNKRSVLISPNFIGYASQMAWDLPAFLSRVYCNTERFEERVWWLFCCTVAKYISVEALISL